MEKTTKAIALAGILFLSIVFLIDGSPADAGPNIGIDDIEISLGDNTSCCIYISDASSIGSVQLSLSWNPSIISLVSVNASESSFDSVYYYFDNIVGQINLNAINNVSLSGDLDVVCLTFEPTNYAHDSDSTDLLFSDTGIFDSTPAGNVIDHTFTDGKATIISEAKLKNNLFKVDNLYLMIDSQESCSIHLLDAQEIGSLEFELSWDPDVLHPVQFIDDDSDFDFVISTIDEIDGSMKVIAFNEVGLSGDLEIASILFESSCVSSVGDSCELLFSNYHIFDDTPIGNLVVSSVEDGKAFITGQMSFGSSFSSIPILSVEDIFVPFEGKGQGCIFIADGVYIGSIELTLSWDPSIATLASVDDSYTTFEKVISYIDNDIGLLNLSAYTLDALSGNLNVACLRFEPKGSDSAGKTCSLSLSNTNLFDATPAGLLMDHTTENGELEIEEYTPPTPPPKGGNGGGGTSGDTNDNTPDTPINNDPTAKFTVSDTNAFLGEKITFDASESSDPDGDKLEYNWDLGDGVNSNKMIFNHSYGSEKSYTVTLSVDDGKGGIDSVTKIINIKSPNIPPEKPSITGTTNGHKQTEYSYQIVSTDSDNDSLKYIIDWGDGNKENTSFVDQGIHQIINHTWNAAGKYIIIVYATDGKTDSSTEELTVLIDVVLVGNLGYLIDEDGDGTYDSCYVESLKRTTNVKCSNSDIYLIDEDDDGEWEYSYSLSAGTLSGYTYEGGKDGQSETDLMIPALIIGIVIVVIIAVAYFKNKISKKT